jgi:hypothetical protein
MNRWTVAGALALTVIAVVMLATSGVRYDLDEQFQSAYGDRSLRGTDPDFTMMPRSRTGILYLYSALSTWSRSSSPMSRRWSLQQRHIVNVAFALTASQHMASRRAALSGECPGDGLTALTPMFYGTAQQPEGHPVCRRVRVDAGVLGAHPSNPAHPVVLHCEGHRCVRSAPGDQAGGIFVFATSSCGGSCLSSLRRFAACGGTKTVISAGGRVRGAC